MKTHPGSDGEFAFALTWIFIGLAGNWPRAVVPFIFGVFLLVVAMAIEHDEWKARKADEAARGEPPPKDPP